MKGTVVPIALAFALTWTVLPAEADFNEHGIGPAAGEVRSSLGSPWEPGSWYAGTSIGLFHLPPGGAIWEFVSAGLPRSTVTSIAAVPLEPGLLFLGIYGYPTGYGIYRSTDGGASWEPKSAGLGSLKIQAVACDPSATSILFAATEEGLYRTTDTGESWQVSGFAGESIRDVVVDPGDPARAWASVAWEGIFRTTDGGDSWQLASNGIGGSMLFYDLKASATGDTVYAVGWGAYRSFDGGDNWTEITADFFPPYSTFPEIAVRAGDAASILLCRFGEEIYRSDDAGETWTEVAPSSSIPIEYQTISASPSAPGRVLAGAFGGELFLSPNDGDSWMPWTAGISTAFMLSVDVQEGRWLAGTRRGVFVSEDYGRTWWKSDLVYDIGAEINSIAIAPGDGMTAFCGNTNGYYKGDVYRSTDGGWHWNLVQNGNGPVRAVAVDPTDPLFVYAGYACDIVPGGVYRSTNGGTGWIHESLGDVCVFALQIDPSDPAVVMAGTSEGIFRSTDHGDTWSPRGPAGVAVVDLSPDASLPERFYAATYGNRAYVSHNGGASWEPFGAGSLPALLHAIEGRDTNVGVLAGSATTGIWRYEGADWVRLDDEDQPPVDEIRALLAIPQMGRFLAGTGGAGIWEYLSDPAGAPEGTGRTEAELRILGSPSRGPFTIRLTLPRAGAVAIDLLDLSGRRVRRFTRSSAQAGTIDWLWNGRDAAGRPAKAGVYFLRVRTDGGLQTGKICLLR